MAIDETEDGSEQARRKVIEAARTPLLDLNDLLARMRPETFHDNADFGRPTGGEFW